MVYHVIPAASVAEVLFRRAVKLAGGPVAAAPVAAWSKAGGRAC